MDTSIYKLLNLNSKASKSVYNLLVKIKGLNCKVTCPADKVNKHDNYEHGLRGSIFGLEDITEYEVVDSYDKRLLLFNIFQEGSQGMEDYDTFLDCFCLTLNTEKLPLQTIIEVNFYGRSMSFKVDDHRNLFPNVGEQLFIKNMLVPAT